MKFDVEVKVRIWRSLSITNSTLMRSGGASPFLVAHTFKQFSWRN
jgi:hypothetical protein